MKRKNARQGKEAKPSALKNTSHSTTDTCAEAQRQRLLSALKKGSVTTPDARAHLNIMAPAARIKELRERGYRIKTSLERILDDRGRLHHKVARYVLTHSFNVSE
jgi:hypothetical protein